MPSQTVQTKTWHRQKLKVRTGCITCKIRKVKCDEVKPACERCTSTGRKCDGYLSPDGPKQATQSSISRGQRSPPRLSEGSSVFSDVASLSSPMSAQERHWLQHFSIHTAPGLSGVADGTFWWQLLPQMSVCEPAVRHALLAVSSCHACLEVNPKGDLIPIDGGQNYSVRHYNLAISTLRDILLSKSGGAEVPLICCLLFMCLECLYRHETLVIDHLRHGIKILDSLRSSAFSPAVASPTQQRLLEIFSRLKVQSILYGNTTPSGESASHAMPMPASILPIDDIFEANTSLERLLSSCLSFIDAARKSRPDWSSSNFAQQRHLQERLLLWQCRMDEFETTRRIQSVPYVHSITNLRIQCTALYIYLSTCMETDETSYDAFRPEFMSIIRLAHLLLTGAFPPEQPSSDLSSSSPGPSVGPLRTFFTLDASLVPSLYLVAAKCRDPNIRREAISLMENHPCREGLWHSKMEARVARRIVELEEEGTLPWCQTTHAPACDILIEHQLGGYDPEIKQLPSNTFRIIDTERHHSSSKGALESVSVIFTGLSDIPGEYHIWEEQLWF